MPSIRLLAQNDVLGCGALNFDHTFSRLQKLGGILWGVSFKMPEQLSEILSVSTLDSDAVGTGITLWPADDMVISTPWTDGLIGGFPVLNRCRVRLLVLASEVSHRLYWTATGETLHPELLQKQLQ